MNKKIIIISDKAVFRASLIKEEDHHCINIKESVLQEVRQP
jgi:hypothetical protein